MPRGFHCSEGRPNQSMKPRPHGETSSVCLPRDPAVAYLFLVRSFMFDTRLSRGIAFAIALFISVAIASVARKGRRAVAMLGTFISSFGVITLVAHKIWQRWGGGAPLEGSLATFGSLMMLTFGGYILWCAFFQNSADHTKSDENKQT